MGLIRWLLQRNVPILPSRDAYQRWAKDYPPHAHNPFMVLETQVMIDLMPDLQGKHVLDLACGTGRWGSYARQAGAQLVYSVDDSTAMLAAGTPALACTASMTHLPLPPHAVDVVLCGLAVGHTPHLDRVFQEISRVLVPGGIALISDVHPFRAWLGGQRTFRSEGKTYAVEHHLHSYSDFHAAAQASQLQIEAVREGGVTPGDPPAVLVLRLASAG